MASSSAAATAATPATKASTTNTSSCTTSNVNNDVVHKSLDVLHRTSFLASTQSTFERILDECQFFRPVYESKRFQTKCTTPCWTNVYGGGDEGHPLYEPIPESLKDLKHKVEQETNLQFNVALVRLYYDGKDNIAWHTDARAFLGSPTAVASLSLGAPRVFEMRMPSQLWGDVSGGKGQGAVVDVTRFHPDNDLVKAPSTAHVTSPAEVSYLLRDGDLLVMKGRTQDFWHHRIPTESARNYDKRLQELGMDTRNNGPKNNGPKPRLNINFRYIPPGKLCLSGTDTYYQYCRAGVTSMPNHNKNTMNAEAVAETARGKCLETGKWFDSKETSQLVYGGDNIKWKQNRLAFPVAVVVAPGATTEAKGSVVTKKGAESISTTRIMAAKKTRPALQPAIASFFSAVKNKSKPSSQTKTNKKRSLRQQPTLFDMGCVIKKAKK